MDSTNEQNVPVTENDFFLNFNVYECFCEQVIKPSLHLIEHGFMVFGHLLQIFHWMTLQSNRIFCIKFNSLMCVHHETLPSKGQI